MTVTTTTTRRSMLPLFAGVASMNTAMVGASTAGTLLAAAAAGSGWSGLPSACGVLGSALGTLGAGTVMARRGSRPVLLAMYGLAVAGALVAFAAAAGTVFAVLLVGMVLVGIGNGAAQLSRYVAAELYPVRRRGFGLSVIVWAGTVGAVAGPALLAPGARVGEWLGLPALAGPVLVAAVASGLALLATATLPRVPPPPARPRLSAVTAFAALRRPVVLTPLVAMVAAQLAMVAVMTMTPLQLEHHGHGLDVVGWTLAAHMIGMFALAPLSGRIADRLGGRVTIGLGIGALVLAAAASAPAGGVELSFGLFLLGYGWNLVFVGGSSLLSRDLPAEERIQLQGVVDAVVWGSSALASLAAGTLFHAGGYALVAVVGGLVAVAPVVLLARRNG
ncbi:MFS transporter [Actinophytocola xanthii]|uniref:MFS transporter n=1 Tax=Actinophytocola xanthii TaxID=1912961 RepID=A0A1Q8CR07_9PSEU|nr:MFS transporter [Actinophytocola xanthii]OLF16767.1 MFS transporter [Actinophytocola xanthii]